MDRSEPNGEKPTVADNQDESFTETPRRRKKKRNSELESGSELSDPGSTLHSPSLGALRTSPRDKGDDVIVVGAHSESAENRPAPPAATEDTTMADAPADDTAPHYPKRKRTSIFEDLSESKIEIPTAASLNKIAQAQAQVKPKPSRPNLGSDKGVTIGYWRDSQAPDEYYKHAVIGFIDVRDRLRTRLQSNNRKGESLINDYPLPPGPGGTWVTFERIVFDPHLVGLDHFQVKEYVRIRADAPTEDTEEGRAAAEKEAVAEAIRRCKMNPAYENPTVTPMIAYGAQLPDSTSSPRQDAKRRRTSGGFAPVNSPAPVNIAPANGTPLRESMAPPGPSSAALLAIKNPNDPLLGTRPTRILVGHWKKSSEPNPRDRHAVYGILGQNDMFRVKLVRETREGNYVDGNFPLGAGALWVNYEEVELEPHLQSLSRQEVKEYCRVRQWQLDNGETPDERIANETTAVYDAQERLVAINGYKPPATPIAPAAATAAPGTWDDASTPELTNGRGTSGGHDLRQSRRNEAKVDGRSSRHSLPDTASESRASTRATAVDAQQRTDALARREIARVEAAQTRADRLASSRERAIQAAADESTRAAAAAAEAAASPALTNGRSRLHQTDDMQRLNRVWAAQESLRVKNGVEDAKVYDGVKYERKSNGPFMGKLVSQGSIINIDGEDYVEYRVLTKPSFF